MKYHQISEEDLQHLKFLIGSEEVFSDQETLVACNHDETENLTFLPDIVLKPSSKEDLAKILAYCNEKKIAVTVRGAGTGLSGGALAVKGGVLISMERFNHILAIDEDNLQVTVEAGVVTEVLQNAVREKGLFYPPDPSSKGSCFIGGNLSYSAGGPKAVKYGTTKDYVLSLEVVLADGSIINTGAKVLKNATGYNLTQLLVGSEGTLGVVTAATLKLLPYPKYDMLMLVPFHVAEDACKAVSEIFKLGIIPSYLEFMEKDALEWGMQHIEDSSMKIGDQVKAHLLIEVDGNDQDVLMHDFEKIFAHLEKYKTDEILFADSSAQKDRLKFLRSRIGEAVKKNSVYRELDTVVPRANLPHLLKGIKEIGNKYGVKSVCYGHAGDGNLHVNVIKDSVPESKWDEAIHLMSTDVFKLCVSLGGTISGEHGIGYVQKAYLPIAIDDKQIELMKAIKKIFDPNLILNPDKIFTDS